MMSSTTLAKVENGLSMLTLRSCKGNEEKTRKSKKKMATRKGDQTPPSSDFLTGPSARVKRFHSKSRNGCLTCRQRRVKCDEQRNPNCARCDKGGYVCDWQDNRLGRSRASEDMLSNTTTRSASLATVRSDEDGASHRFFSEGVVANVTSLFTDMAESFIGDTTKAQNVSIGVSNFYYQLVYQASQSNRIIRKTLTALCSLYERAFATSRSSFLSDHEHISRYSDAVTDLRTSSRELTPDIVLIASILFANCEYLMGDLCSAVRHLRAGARILVEQRDFADKRLSSSLSETLGAIFEAFDHDPVGLESTTPESDYLDTIGEHQFDDLNQANDKLLQIYSHTFALQKVRQNHPSHILPAAHDFQRWSRSWHSRTANLEHSLETEQLPWLQLLRGQHAALNTVIDTMSSSGEAFARDHQIEDLILQVSNFLQICPDSLQDEDIPTRLYLDSVGLILPLFLVTLRCAHGQTCETALSLLGRLRVVEGVLNSCCAYAIAQSAINVRHATRSHSSSTSSSLHDTLPAIEIKKVEPSQSGTEFDVTFAFARNSAFGQIESNAIVGGFCSHGTGAAEHLCEILEIGGFQGPVVTRRLQGCSCHESI